MTMCWSKPARDRGCRRAERSGLKSHAAGLAPSAAKSPAVVPARAFNLASCRNVNGSGRGTVLPETGLSEQWHGANKNSHAPSKSNGTAAAP